MEPASARHLIGLVPRSRVGRSGSPEDVGRPMRTFLLAIVFVTALLPGSQAHGGVTPVPKLSRSLLACEESLELSCVESAEAVILKSDHTVATDVEALQGTWSEAGSILIVGSRRFHYRSKYLLLAPLEEDLDFGYVLFENSRSGRRDIRYREARHTPKWQRAAAHYYLRHRIQVHDTCQLLIYAGDESSVPLLLDLLPNRPPGDNPGVECTYAHCAAALERITGRKCGLFREEWQKCLAEKPPN
jgi:hypothetical protein